MADNEIIFKFADGGGGSEASPSSEPSFVPSPPPQVMPSGAPPVYQANALSSSGAAFPQVMPAQALPGPGSTSPSDVMPNGVPPAPTPNSTPSPEVVPNGAPVSPSAAAPPQVMPTPAGGPGNDEMVGLLKNINNFLALGESRNAQKSELLTEAVGAGESGAVEAGAGAATGGMAAIAMLIADQVKKVASMAPQAVGFGLDESKKLAQNRNFEVLSDVAGKAADGLGMLSPALGAAAHTAIDLGRKFGETVDMFVQLGHKLAPFSGALTEAEIKSDMRSMMGDVREANTLGPDLARLMDAQSRASDELRELLLPIKKWIVEKLADIMSGIADGFEEIRALAFGFDTMLRSFQANVDNWIRQGPQYTAAFIKHVVSEGSKAYEDFKNREKAEDKDGIAIQQLWGLFNQVPGANRPADQKVLDILAGLRGANPALGLPGDNGMMGGGAGGDF